MKVILDFSVLHLMGEDKGKFSVQVDGSEPSVADCFRALADQHPRLFEKLTKIGLLREGEEINAMMISGQQLLRPESNIHDGQEIKIVGQICGG